MSTQMNESRNILKELKREDLTRQTPQKMKLFTGKFQFIETHHHLKDLDPTQFTREPLKLRKQTKTKYCKLFGYLDTTNEESQALTRTQGSHKPKLVMITEISDKTSTQVPSSSAFHGEVGKWIPKLYYINYTVIFITC